jgi:hypothetical protein
VKARTQVSHGEWLPLLKRVGIGDRKAQRLIFIANNLRLANPTHVSRLPPCWGTLYELAKLAPDVLDAGIIDGSHLSPRQRYRAPFRRSRDALRRSGSAVERGLSAETRRTKRDERGGKGGGQYIL